ncbi:MAG: 2-amino-4-hydroxy-6-hydroxymethyldihydropteridine diphosphokinase [Acidimicrobiia bacterium]|nr:2-amino-4-hydroxy-6-hydroxymethyldihydropteridine diphosphokinase [Acidimicrobiia bacterium]
MTRYVIGLGSNLGDRIGTLRHALDELDAVGDIVAVSGIYRSAPIGPEQPEFLNSIVVLDTGLEPGSLLEVIGVIEFEAGRRRLQPAGPRTLDLDILAGPTILSGGELTMPHPRWSERRFVLEPLSEIWEVAQPIAGIDPEALAAAIEETANQDVERLAGSEWRNEPGRGTSWVVIQAVVFALVIGFALVAPDTMTAAVRWPGAAFGIAGALLMLAGVRGLGRNLTAFPEPVKYGELSDEGVYGLVRHPIYGANVLLLMGVALLGRSWLAFLCAAGAGLFFWMKAGAEEVRLGLRYGGYAAYRRKVPHRLLPWIL